VWRTLYYCSPLCSKCTRRTPFPRGFPFLPSCIRVTVVELGTLTKVQKVRNVWSALSIPSSFPFLQDADSGRAGADEPTCLLAREST
jgi:hypothetical protein